MQGGRQLRFNLITAQINFNLIDSGSTETRRANGETGQLQ